MKHAAAIISAWAALSVSASAQQAPPPPEPTSMTRQQLRDEVIGLRAIVQNRAVTPQRPPGCSSAESRQFDFWLGEWDVSPTTSTTGVIVAESSITLTDQGCVILEEWRPFGGAHGHSINIFDAIERRWRQAWADATGRRTEYAGAVDTSGVLRFDNLSPTEAGAAPGRRRMNFQRIDENTVRQWGDVYDEGAQFWTIEWDLTYRRRAQTR